MASIIYKDGESIRVEYEQLKRHLDAGWSVSEQVVEQVVEPEAEQEESQGESMSDYERELRDKIKALGGRVGGRASIETIEKKLAELESE